MRYVFLGILAVVIFIYFIGKDDSGDTGMGMWGYLKNNSGFSSQYDKKTEKFLQQLENKKEDLAFLDHQINDLNEGLKEMPDTNQNQYFTDLLAKIQDKETLLSQQIAQQKQVYRDKFENASLKGNAPGSNLAEQNSQNLQDRRQEMNDLLEAQQMREQAQMERMNELMEENQMRMEALIERTNALAEQNQMRMENFEDRQQR